MPDAPAFYDYAWYGAPEEVEAATQGMPNMLGPVLMDGLAYVLIRSTSPIELPPRLLPIGPNLSTRIFGLWSGDVGDVPAMVTNYQGVVAMMETPGPLDGQTLFDAVDSYCRSQGGRLLQAWLRNNNFYRDSDFIAALEASFLPATPTQTSAQRVDDLFRRAAQVR